MFFYMKLGNQWYTMEARERLSLQRRSENGKEGQVLKSAMHACLAFGRVKELE